MIILSLAARNLWRNKRRTLIALAALVVGTAMVVILNGFRNGMEDLIVTGMVKAQLGAFQIHRKGFMDAVDVAPLKLNFADTPALRAKILGVEGVSALAPRITAAGMAAAGSRSTIAALLAADPLVEVEVFPLAQDFISGRNLRQSKLPNGSVMGGGMMKNLGLQQGDVFTVTAQSPEGQTNAVNLQVEGWVPAMDPFSGKRLLAMRLDFAQNLLRMEGRITEYAVQVHEVARIDELAGKVRAALGPEFEVHTWLEIQPMYRDLLRRQSFVLSSVALVLFVIVLTGIVNVMAMSVYERIREIGTELALGMRRRQVLALFLAEGALLGTWGGVVGTGLGWAAVAIAGAKGVPFKSPGGGGMLPLFPNVSLGFVLLVVGIAAVGAVLASLVPAFRAARLRPADALRAL